MNHVKPNFLFQELYDHIEIDPKLYYHLSINLVIF